MASEHARRALWIAVAAVCGIVAAVELTPPSGSWSSARGSEKGEGVPTCDGQPASIVDQSPDAETILGTKDPDVIVSTHGDDLIRGDRGIDVICGSDQSNIIYGGDERDYVFGQNGADVLLGGSGRDIMLGERGDDTFAGRAYIDRCYGGRPRDDLNGGRGGGLGDGADPSCDKLRSVAKIPRLPHPFVPDAG